MEEAKASAAVAGPARKHTRWHRQNQPGGKQAQQRSPTPGWPTSDQCSGHVEGKHHGFGVERRQDA